MKQAIRYLVIAILVQLALIPVVYWSQLGGSAQAAAHPLLALKAGAVTDILIDGEKNAKVHLHRNGSVWQLPDYQQLPADADKVTTMLRTLSGEQLQWPVSTSADSVHRFEVADDHYQRKLVFSAKGGKAETLYLGSAPAFHKVHVRRAGDNSVYAVAFNTFDAPAEPAQWLNKSLLAIGGSITAIDSGDVELRRVDKAWQLQGDDKAALDTGAVDALVKQLQSLTVEGLAEQGGDVAKLPVARSVQVVADGTTYTLQFKRDKNDIYLNSSARPQWFKVAEYSVKQVLDLDKDAVLQKPATTAAQAAAKPPAAKTNSRPGPKKSSH